MTRTSKVQVLATLFGLLLASAVVWRTSAAAWTDTTDNSGNSFSTGSISISDNDGGSALFSATGLLPGDSVTGCIEVTYDSSPTPSKAVEFYAAHTDTTNGGDGLGDDLDVTVSIGAVGTNCTVIGVPTGVGTTTALESLASSASPISTGWTPDPTLDAMRPFEITVTLGSDTASDAQGESSTATFTWLVTV